MKRDNDFIRELLIEAEASEDSLVIARLTLSATDEETKRHHHAKLLCDAGLFHEEHEYVFRMTNQGYDYLEAIRSPVIWEMVKKEVSKISGAPLSILRDIGMAYLKNEAKVKLGIDVG